MNKATKAIVDYCKENKIEKVFCGGGKGWKRGIGLGDNNNQNLVEIPFDKFKHKFKHELGYYFIKFELVDESYTSKCNALSSTEVRKEPSYRGE